jgi:hypothetical protein
MEEKRPRGRPPRVVGKRVKRSVTFPPGLYAWLRGIAERREQDVSDVIVSILVAERERTEGKEPGQWMPALMAA